MLNDPIWWEILPVDDGLVDCSSNIGNPTNLRSSTVMSNVLQHKAGLTDKRLAKITSENLKNITIEVLSLIDWLLLYVKQAVFHSKQNYFTPFPLYILIYQAVWSKYVTGENIFVRYVHAWL